MSAAPNQITQHLLGYVSEQVACEPLAPDDGRLGCITPLQYPNGDNVIVWVRQRATPLFEVTDYGDALMDSVATGRERRNLEEFVRLLSRGQGVEFEDGRLRADCEPDALGEFVWRLATAASQVALAAAGVPSPRRQIESEFVSEVERTLHERKVPLERERKLDGRSGHTHRATIFLPQIEAVVEPVTANWNQVNAVYARFGDLARANGFRLFSMLDDRRSPEEEIEKMLLQVGAVVPWSRRDLWLDELA